MKISKGAPKMADSVLKTRQVDFADMFKAKEPKEAAHHEEEPKKLAEGGEVKKDFTKKEDKGFGSIIMESDKDSDKDETHYGSVAEAIRAKGKKPQKLADGGMVQDDDADLKENYSDDDFKHLDDIAVPDEDEDDSSMSVAQKIRRKTQG